MPIFVLKIWLKHDYNQQHRYLLTFHYYAQLRQIIRKCAICEYAKWFYWISTNSHLYMGNGQGNENTLCPGMMWSLTHYYRLNIHCSPQFWMHQIKTKNEKNLFVCVKIYKCWFYGFKLPFKRVGKNSGSGWHPNFKFICSYIPWWCSSHWTINWKM